MTAKSMRPRSTQLERRSEAERRLVAAAAELIAEGGPSRVTLALVGERAGYSRGLATHHFGSKAALMQRVVDSVSEQFESELKSADSSEPVLQQLLGLVRLYMKVLPSLSAVQRARLVLMADAVTPSSEVRDVMLESDRGFRAALAKGIRRGVLSGEFARGVDAQGLSCVIVGLLRGVAFQVMIDESISIAKVQREIEQLLMTRLSSTQDGGP